MNTESVAITGAELKQRFEKIKSKMKNGTKVIIAEKLVVILSEYETINSVLFIRTGEQVIQSLRAECEITEMCHLFWREVFLVRLAAKICPPDFARAIKEAMESMVFVEEPGGIKGVYRGFIKKIAIKLMFWL